MRKGTTVSLVGALFAAVAVSGTSSAGTSAPPSKYDGPEKDLPYTLSAPKLKSGFHYKVGFMTAYAAIPALARVIDANRAETKKLGGTFILKDAALSPNTQATQLNELINAGVDAIELNPVNPQALLPGLKAARKKGIAIVTHDWPSVAGEHLLPGISTDLLNGRDGSTFSLMQAAAKADPGGSYVYLQLGLPIPVLQYTLTRMSYWAKRFGMKNLGTISTTDDTAAGQGNAMTAILSKYPDVTTVMAYSDSAAGAAGSVARASGKANVKVWGNNGEPNVMKQIKAGRVYGTFNSDFTSSGRLMAIAVYDLLTHQNLPLPKQIGLGGKVVTKANVGHANPLGVDGPLPPVSAATSRRVAAAAKLTLPSLAKLYAGTNKAPGGAPVPAQKGKKVFVISCGQAASGCSIPTAGAVAAGKELGWDVTTLDVAFDLSKQGPMVDQAIAGGAQGIIVVGDDCSLSPAALQRAKDAHIPVDNVYGADCNEPYQPGDPVGADLWTDVPTAGYTTNPAFFAAFGVAKAQYFIAKSKGTARVITSDITDVALLVGQVRAFKNAMAKCKTCKVYDVHSKALDFGPNLQRITQQAVLQHPDANAVAPTNDSVYFGGVEAGLKAAGGKKLLILGSDGTPPGMKLLKSGELAAELAFPSDWYGWAAADTMNSLLAGKTPRNSGVGWQLIDKSHNMKLIGSDGGYQPAIDYKAAYRKLWGLK